MNVDIVSIAYMLLTHTTFEKDSTIPLSWSAINGIRIGEYFDEKILNRHLVLSRATRLRFYGYIDRAIPAFEQNQDRRFVA